MGLRGTNFDGLSVVVLSRMNEENKLDKHFCIKSLIQMATFRFIDLTLANLNIYAKHLLGRPALDEEAAVCS